MGQLSPALRNLVFVSGKGGVGKTSVSQALAQALAHRGKKTLWVAFEDPDAPPGELKKVSENLWHLNAEAMIAFEEYAAMKIEKLGLGALTRIFLQNKLIRYLAKAAPGLHELVLLGKVWHERTRYDHVIVDMPSTGYGVAMLQSTLNFARLFKSGPLARDAEEMLATFRDPKTTAHLIIALPEEMPLREGIELAGFIGDLFPENPPAFLLNRRFPGEPPKSESSPDRWPTPFAKSVADYASKRLVLEAHNLKLWTDRKIDFAELHFSAAPNSQALVNDLAAEFEERILP